ncbi:MAG: YeeE/YedE thiosulfate transporter family protein [Bacillota bacterium]
MGLMEIMKKKSWSPYAAGAFLGVVATLAYWLSDQLLGGSGTFETLDSTILKATGAPWAEQMYFKYIMPAGLNWQLFLIIGVVLGAFVSSKSSGDFHIETAPPQWVETFGGNRWTRWISVFLAGAILEYGAGIAGGCTSGLAISGSLQLAPAGFLFIGGMFASGVVTTKLLYGRKY